MPDGRSERTFEELQEILKEQLGQIDANMAKLRANPVIASGSSEYTPQRDTEERDMLMSSIKVNAGRPRGVLPAPPLLGSEFALPLIPNIHALIFGPCAMSLCLAFGLFVLSCGTPTVRVRYLVDSYSA